MAAPNDRRLRLMAYNVRSLWNVGSFFRTCDALKVERIYLTGYTGHPPRNEISKVAIGAEEYVPWEGDRDPLPFLHAMKEEGWQLLALELLPASGDLTDFQAADKVCLIVGHELTGVPEDILSLCDASVQIPMLGTKESLNVAVAAGIALHELRMR